jgi:hypothetical protein
LVKTPFFCEIKKAVMIHGLFAVGIKQKSRGARKRLSTAFSLSDLET